MKGVITLYGPRAAPFVEKVARALAVKGLAFELREPTGPEDFRRWNPETGLLPLLDLGSERVHDSTAIVLRLEELHPEPPLLSRDPRTRAAQLNLESWADESLFWYWLRWQRLSGGLGGGAVPLRPGPEPAGSPTRDPRRPTRQAKPKDSRAASRGVRGLLERRRARAGPDPAAALLRELDQRLRDLVRLLAGRPFFYSDQLSLADLAVFAMLRGLSRESIPGGAALLRRHPELLAHLARVEESTTP